MITDEWDNYLIWAERCNNAAEEQYEREQREQPPTPTPEDDFRCKQCGQFSEECECEESPAPEHP